MAFTRTGGSWIHEYAALSTDTKYTKATHPNIDVPNGSACIEIDTDDIYLYDKDNDQWCLFSSGGGGGGSGGTTNYNQLSNKPKINNVELSGNKTIENFGIASSKDLTDLSNAIDQLQPAATSVDVGKALIVKTVDTQTGKPTSYEYGEAGGGNVDIEFEPYSMSKTYAVGDYCEQSGGMYQCNTPITTAEAWNSAHWTAITASDLIGDMNDRLDMVVIMQEVKQDVPETTSSQIVDPETMITYKLYNKSYAFYVTGKIPLDKDGAYYENPYRATSSDPEQHTLYNAMFYDAYDQILTLTKTSDGSTVTKLTLFNTYGAYFVIENRRTIKRYVRSSLSDTYTTDADIAYLSGTNSTYFGYWPDETPVSQIGITYNEASSTYIPYGGGPAPEPEYEWNYTVPMAQFVEAYMQTHGTAASNNMFNFVYPERNNSEFANTLKYYHERFDRQKDDIIRIGSFNKFISRGGGNWSTIKQELADYTLDICGFQESPAIVDSGAVTAQIGEALQGQQFTSYAEQNTTVDQAIVSHWEVTDTNCYTLITKDDESTRTAINAVIKLYPYKWYSNFVDNAATLSVYSYHGSSQSGVVGGVSKTSYELRMMEINTLLGIVAQDTADFIVIVGDTNCFEAGLDTTTAKHAEWEAFRTAGYLPVLDGHESSVTADLASTHFFVAGDGKAYCDACYDQIFIGSNIEAIGHSVVDSNLYPVESLGGVPVSDHCMVYADLKFDFDAVMNAKMVAELS